MLCECHVLAINDCVHVHVAIILFEFFVQEIPGVTKEKQRQDTL